MPMVPKVVVHGVPDRDFRAQAGAEDLVKRYQFTGASIAGGLFVLVHDLLSDGGRAKTLTFQGQVSQFVPGIEHAEPPVEFQAIDDHRLGEQADVLRPEVAMRVDDASVFRPLFKKGALFRQKLPLSCRQAIDPRFRKSVPAVAQLGQIALNVRLELAPILGRADGQGRRKPVESRQYPTQLLHILGIDGSFENRDIEHAVGGQAAHLHQPVHHPAFAAQLQAVIRFYRERHDAEINAFGQPPVEMDLAFAVRFPGLQSAEIKVIIPDGLFQLVNQPIGQKNPGHVSFDDLDAFRPVRIAGRLLKEGYLFFNMHVCP